MQPVQLAVHHDCTQRPPRLPSACLVRTPVQPSSTNLQSARQEQTPQSFLKTLDLSYDPSSLSHAGRCQHSFVLWGSCLSDGEVQERASIRSRDRSRGRIGNKEILANPVMQNYSPWASVSLYEVEGSAALFSTTLQQQSPCFHGAELRLETAQIWRYQENMVLGWWASAAHAPRLSQRHKEVSQAPLLAPSHDRQHSPPYVSLLNKGYKDTGLWMC